MGYKDVIDMLQVVKRREIVYNDKLIKKFCAPPSESNGAQAIDAAIAIISALNESNVTLEEALQLAQARDEKRIVIIEDADSIDIILRQKTELIKILENDNQKLRNRFNEMRMVVTKWT